MRRSRNISFDWPLNGKGASMFLKVSTDLRYTLRTMRRSPGLVIAAVLTLAIGIGANTAIFSIVDAVFLRSLPFPEPHRLVNLSCDLAGTNLPDVGISTPELEDFRDRSGVFQELSAVWPMDGNLTGGDRPERIEALAVSAGYFKMLGTKPSLGRLFLPEDGHRWISQTTVISYGIWKRLFGADPKVLGRRVYLDYDPFVVAGVLPPEFHHPGSTLQNEPDFYITGSFRGGAFPLNPSHGDRMIPSAIGRLMPGVTVEQAQSRLDGFAHQLSAQYPRDYPTAARWTPRITSLQASLAVGSSNILLVTMGAVMLVLLTCCATIANLLLARASGRRKEFSIRAALGASRVDILRQLAVESFTLSFLGALLGVILAIRAIPLLVELAPISLPRHSWRCVGIHAAGHYCNGGFVRNGARRSLFTAQPDGRSEKQWTRRGHGQDRPSRSGRAGGQSDRPLFHPHDRSRAAFEKPLEYAARRCWLQPYSRSGRQHLVSASGRPGGKNN
jgi:predicted permease